MKCSTELKQGRHNGRCLIGLVFITAGAVYSGAFRFCARECEMIYGSIKHGKLEGLMMKGWVWVLGLLKCLVC